MNSRKRLAEDIPASTRGNSVPIRQDKKDQYVRRWLFKLCTMEIIFPTEDEQDNDEEERKQQRNQFHFFLQSTLKIMGPTDVFQSAMDVNNAQVRHLFGRYVLKEIEEKITGKVTDGKSDAATPGLYSNEQYVTYHELYDEFFIKLVDYALRIGCLSEKTDDEFIEKLIHFARICAGVLNTYSPHAHLRIIQRAKSVLGHILDESDIFREKQQALYNVNLEKDEIEKILFDQHPKSQITQSTNSSNSSTGTTSEISTPSERMKEIKVTNLSNESRSNVIAICLTVLSTKKVDFQPEWQGNTLLRRMLMKGTPSLLVHIVQFFGRSRFTNSASTPDIVNAFEFLFLEVTTAKERPAMMSEMKNIISSLKENRENVIFEIILRIWPVVAKIMKSPNSPRAEYFEFLSEMLVCFKGKGFSRSTHYRIGLLYWSIILGKELKELVPAMRQLFSEIFGHIKDGLASASIVLRTVQAAFKAHIVDEQTSNIIKFETMIAIFILELAKLPNVYLLGANKDFENILETFLQLSGVNFEKSKSRIEKKIFEPIRTFFADSNSVLKINESSMSHMPKVAQEPASETTRIQEYLTDIAKSNSWGSSSRKFIAQAIRDLYSKGKGIKYHHEYH